MLERRPRHVQPIGGDDRKHRLVRGLAGAMDVVD